ncbi:LSM domain protein [Opisthorchis viverrini]|uniref:LSM domain protein n=1 Tax=Opisthorchis viverrini TaxID=6198 RepID=A0A1S8WYI9_OPIVI|nr:LSM domain protein [Opisthorchis viverrini]
MTDQTPSSAVKAKTEAREFLDNLCDKLLTVHVTDGRRFVGQLWCTDSAANLVLGSCVEYPSPSDSFYDDSRRNLMAVVIPGQHITKVECVQSVLSE